MKKSYDFEELLREYDFKVTSVRVALLKILDQSNSPINVESLSKKLKNANRATIYRALSAFSKKGIVKILTITKKNSLYELSIKKSHKHHIVCTDCGTIEDIDFCIKNINTSAEKKSKLFKKIKNHNISFMGTCRKCVRAVR